MLKEKNALLVLEDGSLFEGHSMGAEGEFVGEVVFNTSMTGYQEIITDPSYWGQMVTFTCPHIGNVGVNSDDVESHQPYVRAVIARSISTEPSNWRAQQSLPDYLRDAGIPALAGVDTRRLTLTLRDKGVMRGALSTINLDSDRLLQMARHTADMSELTPVSEVSREVTEEWTQGVQKRWIQDLGYSMEIEGPGPHIVVVDCGIKQNILRYLANLGARVTVVPSRATAEQILALAPDGVLLSNGPGDPEQAKDVIATTRDLLGQTPIFGICLGHQIIGLAAGGIKQKLPFGHHGGNHPVQDLRTGHVAMTAQNHNYVIDAESLRDLDFEITHINLYDGTLEGMRHRHLPVYSVQYHPEASPGPHDSLRMLHEFVASLADEPDK